MSRIYTIATYTVFVLFAAAFFVRCIFTLDHDFGWHYSMGQYILSYGIPMKDPYSYTMPKFPYVEHEWPIDVAMYVVYQFIGWYGLAAIYTMIALSTLIILFLHKRDWITLISLLFTASIFVWGGGIRDQVIPWLLIALVLWICRTERLWQRTRYILPIIIFLWVNMHASFPFGVGIVVLYVIARSINRRAIDWIDCVVVVLCCIVVFINPYTWHLWEEVWREQFTTSWHSTISEWNPAIDVSAFSFWFFFPLSLVLVFLYRKDIPLFYLLLYAATLIMALSSIRHIPLWAISAFIVATEGFDHLQKQLVPHPDGQKIFYRMYAIFLSLAIISVGCDLWSQPPALQYPYPAKAIVYLEEHGIDGNVFNEYNWGGYMIWKLPGVKVFVDGRMPAWHMATQNPHESTDAYQEYQDIFSGKELLQYAAQKYDIGTILWSSSNDQADKQFLQEARKAGFKEVYRDNVAVIYEK